MAPTAVEAPTETVSVNGMKNESIGDDFGDFRAIAPVCYMRVGVRNEELQAVYAHHHPRFRIDESALPLAAAWLVKSCEMYLEGR